MSHMLSGTGNPLTAFVNLCQTAEERRDKYGFCRFMGVSHPWARRMRDWHWTRINTLCEVLVNKPQGKHV